MQYRVELPDESIGRGQNRARLSNLWIFRLSINNSISKLWINDIDYLFDFDIPKLLIIDSELSDSSSIYNGYITTVHFDIIIEQTENVPLEHEQGIF